MLLRAEQLYRRWPPDSQCGSIFMEVLRYTNASKAMDVAISERYDKLLYRSDHIVQVFITGGADLKKQPLKVSRYIFEQCSQDNIVDIIGGGTVLRGGVV